MEKPALVYTISIFENGEVWIEAESKGFVDPERVSEGTDVLKKSLEELIGPAKLKEAHFSTNKLDS